MVRRRTFGRTGWSVGQLGVGMWGMAGWTGSQDEESERSLDRAVELTPPTATVRTKCLNTRGLCFVTKGEWAAAEREFRLTRACLEVLLEARQACGIITKNSLVTRDLDLLTALAAERLVNVRLSITTLDSELARTMEPRTASPQARLRAIRELRADLGGHRLAGAGHAEDRDEVEEARRRARRGLDARGAGGRREEEDGADAVSREDGRDQAAVHPSPSLWRSLTFHAPPSRTSVAVMRWRTPVGVSFRLPVAAS